jgi:AcrR family transcriptional regulator
MKKRKANNIPSAQKILEAARAEFAEYGLDGGRVDRIARRARVNKAMIYYHFHSKDKLYQAVIDDHFAHIADFIEKNIAGEYSLEVFLERMAAFLNKTFAERGNFKFIFLREMAAGGERIITPFTRLMSEKGLNWSIKKMIDKGKKDGLFRNVDTVHAIVAFIGMNLIYLIASPIVNSIWEIKDEQKFRERHQKEVVDLLLHGLKVR